MASLPKDALHLLLVFAVERLKKCPGGLKWHRQFAQNYAAVACTAKLGMANEEWKRWLTAAYQELRTQKAPMVSRGKKKIRLPGRLVLYNYEFGRRAIEAAKAERARQKSEGGLSQRAVATKWRTALQTVLNDMAKFPMHNEMWVHLVRENELPRELLGAAENSSASEASLAFLCYLYDVSPGYLKKKLFPPLRKSPSVLFCHYLSDPH